MGWVKKVKECSMILGALNLSNDYAINIIQNLQQQKAGFWEQCFYFHVYFILF